MYLDEEFMVVTVAEVCETLHGSKTGLSEPMDEDEEDSCLDYLRKKIQGWTPSVLSRSERYDNAVRELILATLAEYE